MQLESSCKTVYSKHLYFPSTVSKGYASYIMDFMICYTYYFFATKISFKVVKNLRFRCNQPTCNKNNEKMRLCFSFRLCAWILFIVFINISSVIPNYWKYNSQPQHHNTAGLISVVWVCQRKSRLCALTDNTKLFVSMSYCSLPAAGGPQFSVCAAKTKWITLMVLLCICMWVCERKCVICVCRRLCFGSRLWWNDNAEARWMSYAFCVGDCFLFSSLLTHSLI